MTIGNTPGIDTESQYNSVYCNQENLHSGLYVEPPAHRKGTIKFNGSAFGKFAGCKWLQYFASMTEADPTDPTVCFVYKTDSHIVIVYHRSLGY